MVMFLRYKPIGWRNESSRHALAARGIHSRFVQKVPLNQIIYGRTQGERAFAPVQQVQLKENKPDYMEPFRAPEEKSDIGKQMIETKISSKIVEIDQYMTSKKVSFDDRKRIMDHYVYPLIEKFRQGHMTEQDFDAQIDDKVKHNANMHSQEFRPFAWGDCDEKEPKHGAFNFIDKARENK